MYDISTKKRCPLKYPIVRYLDSLNPTCMVKLPDSAETKFFDLLQKLVSCKLNTPGICDTILEQYKRWIYDAKTYHRE